VSHQRIYNDDICVNNPAESINVKTAKGELAVNFVAKAGSLESTIHAVERIASEGKGKPAQLIPIRFVFTSKLSKNDRLLILDTVFKSKKRAEPAE